MFYKKYTLHGIDYELPLVSMNQWFELTGVEDLEYRKNLIKTFIGEHPRSISQWLLIRLLADSVSQDEYMVYTDEVQAVVNFDLLTVDKIEPLIYDFGNFKIEFKEPGFFDDDYSALMIVKSIDKIYTKDEVLTLEDLNDDEIEKLLLNLTEHFIIDYKTHFLKPLKLPVYIEETGETEVITGFEDIFEIIK